MDISRCSFKQYDDMFDVWKHDLKAWDKWIICTVAAWNNDDTFYEVLLETSVSTIKKSSKVALRFQIKFTFMCNVGISRTIKLNRFKNLSSIAWIQKTISIFLIYQQLLFYSPCWLIFHFHCCYWKHAAVFFVFIECKITT